MTDALNDQAGLAQQDQGILHIHPCLLLWAITEDIQLVMHP